MNEELIIGILIGLIVYGIVILILLFLNFKFWNYIKIKENNDEKNEDI